MLAATLAMIPIIGQGASAIATKGFSSAERYQEGLGGMSQLTGREQSAFYGAGRDLTGIGYSKAPFLELQRRTAIARGGVGASRDAARDIAFLERGTGFGADIFLEQERLTRAGGLGAREGTQRLMRGLQGVGAVQGQDISLLGEYLPILVTGIASLDESFKNPDVLRGVMSSIIGGARTPTTPQVEALQFRALSRLNPGASLLELEAQREDPTNIKYIEGLFEQLQGVSPNKEIFARNLKGTFGLSASLALKAAESYGKRGFNLSDFAGEAGLLAPEKRAELATGELRAGTALFTEKFETVGQALIDTIQELVGLGKGMPEGLEKFTATIVQAEKDRKESVDALILSENRLERVMGRLAGSVPIGYGPGI
jgi:hypothetical protein